MPGHSAAGCNLTAWALSSRTRPNNLGTQQQGATLAPWHSAAACNLTIWALSYRGSGWQTQSAAGRHRVRLAGTECGWQAQSAAGRHRVRLADTECGWQAQSAWPAHLLLRPSARDRLMDPNSGSSGMSPLTPSSAFSVARTLVAKQAPLLSQLCSRSRVGACAAWAHARAGAWVAGACRAGHARWSHAGPPHAQPCVATARATMRGHRTRNHAWPPHAQPQGKRACRGTCPGVRRAGRSAAVSMHGVCLW